MKKCGKCGEVKKLEEFSKKRDGLQSKCRSCSAKYHLEWYDKNREKRKKQVREYKKNNYVKVKRYGDIYKAKLIFYCGEQKDLLTMSENEFNKMERIFKLQGKQMYLKNINLIREVRHELSIKKSR